MIARRNFLCGIGSLLIAAPAIVRYGNIMPVRSLDDWYTYEYIAYSYFDVRSVKEFLLPGFEKYVYRYNLRNMCIGINSFRRSIGT